MTAYRGRIRPSPTLRQLSTFKKFGAWTVAATSNVAGVINSAFVVSPSTLNDWGDIQNDWQEYRILGFRVEYIPNYENSPPATTNPAGGLIIGIIDRTSTTVALSSTQQALEFEGAQYASVNKKITLESKAQGTNELAWTNITTSNYWASCRFYSTPLTASTSYGNFVVSLLVELRSAL